MRDVATEHIRRRVDDPRRKHAELEVAMKGLAAFVEENEPQLISYGMFLDDDRRRMTVVAVHPDSTSLEFPMDIGGPEFRKFTSLIHLSRIEIHGHVSDAVLDRLHGKARMLGQGTVTVHELYAGFAR